MGVCSILAVDGPNSSLTIRHMSRRDWAQKWNQMSDKDLESAVRYYLWLATSFPDMQDRRLNEVIAEAIRRGKPEIVDCAKASLQAGRASG